MKDDHFLVFSGPACAGCAHFVGQKGKMTCAAYPSGIPARFKQADVRHTSVQGDQVGTYTFTAKAETVR